MVQAKWLPGGADIADGLAVREAVFGTGKEAADDYGWHLTVYSGEKAVGCARLAMERGALTMAYAGTLPGERGQGYGDLIVRVCWNKALRLGATSLRARGDNAAFLAAYGFTPAGEGVFEISAENMDFSGKCDGCAQRFG